MLVWRRASDRHESVSQTKGQIWRPDDRWLERENNFFFFSKLDWYIIHEKLYINKYLRLRSLRIVLLTTLKDLSI